MKILIKILAFIVVFYSCNNSSPHSSILLVETIDSLINESDKVAIIPITKTYNAEDIGISLTDIELRNLKEYSHECNIVDSCGEANGQIVFYKNLKQIGNIPFCTDIKCPIIYINSDNRLFTFGMAYRIGTFLNEALNESSKNHP